MLQTDDQFRKDAVGFLINSFINCYSKVGLLLRHSMGGKKQESGKEREAKKQAEAASKAAKEKGVRSESSQLRHEGSGT